MMSYGAQKVQQQYRKETLRAMDPKDRLYLTFDLVWKAANEGDEMRLLQLLLLLRKAVRMEEYPLIALNALRLYNHCERLIKEKRDFAAVAHIFFELKRALGSAQDRPEVSVETEHAEKRKNGGQSALYFGCHGVHYGPKPNGSRRKTPNDGNALGRVCE